MATQFLEDPPQVVRRADDNTAVTCGQHSEQRTGCLPTIPLEDNDSKSSFVNRAALSKAADCGEISPDARIISQSISSLSSCESLNLIAVKLKHERFLQHKDSDEQNMKDILKMLEDSTSNIHVSHLLQPYGSKVSDVICLHINSSASFELWASPFFKPETRKIRIKAILEWEKKLLDSERHADCPAPILLLQYLAISENPVMVWNVLEGLQSNALISVKENIEDFIRNLPVGMDPVNRVRYVKDDLPSFLKDVRESASKWTPQIIKPLQVLRSNIVCKGVVLLTFVGDGKEDAKEIKLKLSEPDNKMRYFHTVFLSDFSKSLQEGHETRKIIFFYKRFRFIVPILTDGYLKMIYDVDANTDKDYAQSSDLDTKFASFINNIFMGEFIGAGLINRKVRCFFPQWNGSLKVPCYPPYSCYAKSIAELIKILQ